MTDNAWIQHVQPGARTTEDQWAWEAGEPVLDECRHCGSTVDLDDVALNHDRCPICLGERADDE